MIFAYNTSRQESTGYTPLYLIYGNEALLPFDIELSGKLNPFEAKNDLDYATRLGQQLKKPKLLVTQKLHQVHLPQKAQYDKWRRHQEFKVGTSVLQILTNHLKILVILKNYNIIG